MYLIFVRGVEQGEGVTRVGEGVYQGEYWGSWLWEQVGGGGVWYRRNVRGCVQKFPDWVDNEIYAYNNEHSSRSNTKGYGGETH
jgi:hypothetical protein